MPVAAGLVGGYAEGDPGAPMRPDPRIQPGRASHTARLATMSLVRAAALFASIAALATSGCYSLAVEVVPLYVRSPDTEVGIVAECCWDVDALPGAGPASRGVSALTGLLLYPVDVVASTVEGVHALASERVDVRGGVSGAFAGILLPWVTLYRGSGCTVVPGLVADVDRDTHAQLVQMQEQDPERLAALLEASLPFTRFRIGDVRLTREVAPVVPGWTWVDVKVPSETVRSDTMFGDTTSGDTTSSDTTSSDTTP